MLDARVWGVQHRLKIGIRKHNRLSRGSWRLAGHHLSQPAYTLPNAAARKADEAPKESLFQPTSKPSPASANANAD
jgi:hypothetical protein